MPGQKDGWKDRTDRSYFIGPFRLLPGSKPTLSLVYAGPPDRASVLSTKCGGCHPKGLIVASPYKVKQIYNNNISFARQEQKSTETLIFILLS